MSGGYAAENYKLNMLYLDIDEFIPMGYSTHNSFRRLTKYFNGS